MNNVSRSDKWILKHHPVFRTRAEAKDYKWYLEQLDEYSKGFSKEEWEDENIEKYYLYYKHRSNALEIYDTFNFERSNVYYFTKESIEQFRKIVGDERIKKYMFNIWE